MSATAGNSLLKKAVHSLGTNILLIPIGFLLSIIVARVLGPVGKGGYDLFIATGGLLMVLVNFSLPSGITYVTAMSRVSLRSLWRSLSLVAVAQGLLTCLLLGVAAWSGFIWGFLPREIGPGAIALSAAYVLLTISASYWRAILTGHQKIVQANQITLLTRIFDLGILLALIGMSALSEAPVDVHALVWLLLVSAVLSNALFLRQLAALPRASGIGTSGLREIVAYAAPCYLANLVQFLNYRLDFFLVSFFVGQHGLGLYALAVSLAQLVWLPSNAASTVLLPIIAGQQNAVENNAHMTARATRFALWISVSVGLSFSLVAVIGLPLLYGETFRDSIPALLWLMPGIIGLGPAFVLASYIAAVGKPRINMLISIASLCVTVALDLLLIPRLNIRGAAIASTAAYLLTTILTTAAFLRLAQMPLQALLLPTADDKRMLIALSHAIYQRLRLQNISLYEA